MKKTTRRLMATCMVLGMAAMALGGCSSSKKKVIGVSLPTQDLARTQKDQEYLTKYLTEMGYEVNVQFGKGDANIQASSIENMITSGVAGLIISPFDSSSMTKVIELAHENNIPVISYDSLCLNTEYIDYYSADDLEGIGACQAQYIVDHLGVAEGKGPFISRLWQAIRLIITPLTFIKEQWMCSPPIWMTAAWWYPAARLNLRSAERLNGMDPRPSPGWIPF